MCIEGSTGICDGCMQRSMTDSALILAEPFTAALSTINMLAMLLRQDGL